jgi:predicted DCC family thiol-disulfide oxidoreductase YuxK
MNQRTKPAVLFDGACPLCRREIEFYRRRRGAERLDWIDISTAPPGAQVCGVNARDAMVRFHVVRADGKPLSGAAAFMEVWRHLRLFRPLAFIFGNRAGVWLLERAYRGFLRLRPRIQRLLPN